MEKITEENELNKNKYKRAIYFYGPDIIALIILFISGIVYTYGIENFLDITGNDESMYLYWGNIFPNGFPIPEWSPVYVLWYYFLNLLEPDTISLYYLNYILMTVLPGLVIYVFLRVNKVQLIISFTCSVLFLINYSNFPTWPKVSHFALLVLLAGLIVCSLLAEIKSKVSAFTLSLLVASFIRPEFYISFIIAAIILSILCFRDFITDRSLKSVVSVLPVAIASLVFISLLGIPAGSGDRSFTAFGQHYARNWVNWNNDPRNHYFNFREILKEDFENANSISEAISKNPSAIVKHAGENIRTLPKEFSRMFLNLYPYNYLRKIILLSAFIIMITALIPFSRNADKLIPISYSEQLKKNFRFYRSFYLTVLTALTPVLLSIIIIYPRRHYLLIPVILIMLMITTIFFRNVLI